MAILLGYHILKQPLDKVDFDNVKVINTINPHSYCIAKKDKVFEKALLASDVLLPDGIGIVWAEKYLNHNKIERIPGFSLFMHLMSRANTNGHKVFFLGASESTLEKMKLRAGNDFPNVKLYSFSPPYKTNFSEEENNRIKGEVNAVEPDLLFIGMTAPKQEKWVYKNKNELNAKLIGSIGAVFDFYAGTKKRPSKFWIKLGLEWLPRFLGEPKRLFRRNFISTPTFIWDVLNHSKAK